MDVVLRAVNQRFLSEVVLPNFELGAVDGRAALERLWRGIADPAVRADLELMMEIGGIERLGDLEQERLQQLADRLLFADWRRTANGWEVGGEALVFADDYDDVLHAALMLFTAEYPYWDPKAAAQVREAMMRPPFHERGLSALVGGIWESVPSFSPGELLSTRGTDLQRPDLGICIADWSYRDAKQVQEWAATLPRAIAALVRREVKRLAPVEVPEAADLLQYWQGQASEAPTLLVAFSGLGPSAARWVTQVGQVANLLRRAATEGRALLALLTGGSRSWL